MKHLDVMRSKELAKVFSPPLQFTFNKKKETKSNQTLFELPKRVYRKIPKISPSKYKPPELVTQKTVR